MFQQFLGNAVINRLMTRRWAWENTRNFRSILELEIYENETKSN